MSRMENLLHILRKAHHARVAEVPTAHVARGVMQEILTECLDDPWFYFPRIAFGMSAAVTAMLVAGLWMQNVASIADVAYWCMFSDAQQMLSYAM